MSQQAVSKARSHFDHTPFEGMFRLTVEERYGKWHKIKRKFGHQIIAIDGSFIRLPNSKDLLETYGGIGRGATAPTGKASIMVDILNDYIMDASLSKCGSSERALAVGHIEKLLEIRPRGKKLLLFDRGYPSLELIQFLTEKKLHFLMRVRSKWNLEVDRATQSDSIISLSGGSKIRVIKLTLPSGETETLITNLWKLGEEHFAALYFLRWPVETKYDVVKNKLALENFSGLSENVILQDFWTCMLLANVVAVAKQEASVMVDKQRNSKDNAYLYVPNTADLVNSLKDEFVMACLDASPSRRSARIDAVIEEISRSVIPIRPDRHLPRPPHPRRAKFLHNSKQRL